MNRRGFTIIELVIVITIMGVLMTLGVVNLRSAQANSRDTERRLDIETIAQHLETSYSGGNDGSATNVDCTGGNVTHDGAYTVHKFTASGTLVCTSTFTAAVLVVAGGGSGAASSGGGGGGGYLAGSETVTGTMPVTVGSGGTTNLGNKGGDSVFGTMTASGGGGGLDKNGGSGAGGASSSTVETTGGTGIVGQGRAGGGNMSWTAYPNPSGGGGGAGNVGSGAPNNSRGGNGGAGINNDIVMQGTDVGYAGGGGGGLYGLGTVGTATHGGGSGGTSAIDGTAGTPNTGGGGGGGGLGRLGGAGGSGVVIIRYPTPIGIGTYPSTLFLGTLTSIKLVLRDIDPDSLIAPGLAVIGDDDTAIAAHVASTFIAATNNTQTTAGVLPQPTIDQYVYQPLHSDGSLCNDTTECRKFNLYYRSEVDNSVNMVSSINQ